MTTRSPRATRLALVLGLPLAALATAAVPLLLFGAQLPPLLASHFDLSGTPDDSVARSLFFTTGFIILAILIAIGALVALWPRPLPQGLVPLFSGTTAFGAQLTANILAFTVLSQRGLEDWHQARGPVLALVWIIGLAVFAGGLAAFLAADLPSRHLVPPPSEPTPPLKLAPGEYALWTETLRRPWITALSLLLLATTVVLPLVIPWPFVMIPLFALVVVTLASLAFARIELRVDHRGLEILYGPFAFPRQQIPLERIQRASTTAVRPLEWGGFGYRGSLKFLHRAALVLRRGPGLRLDLKDDSLFLITLDDPTTPAALLSAEIERRAGR